METQGHVTSTGHQLSDAGFLDLHFEINRSEYEQIVGEARFESGWHVLDAGCGAGSFLPLIADRVGQHGKLTAVDLAPENVEITNERVEGWGLPNVVDVREASIHELPFSDDTFDAVWCANVSQYLTDEELDCALAEISRVTRPGGLVLVKESASIFTLFEPAPPCAKQLLIAEAARQGGVQAAGVIRAWNLQGYLERAGLASVEQRTSLAEHRAPLTALEKEGFSTLLTIHAEVAADLSLPVEYEEFWQKQIDPNAPDSIINHPNFYVAEGLTLAAGRVPAIQVENDLRSAATAEAE